MQTLVVLWQIKLTLLQKFIEKLAKKNKINYLIFRLYQVYGPFQKLDRLVPFTIDNCIKDKTFDCSTGEQYQRFFIY